MTHHMGEWSHYSHVVARWGRVRGAAWLVMKYACERCGREWDAYAAPGIEGPDRDSLLYLPCPLNIGTCPDDGAWVSHVRWSEDREDPSASIVVPEGSPYFFVGKWSQQAELYGWPPR